MQLSDVSAYQSTYSTLLSTPNTVANLSTIQGLVSTLDSQRLAVLNEQSGSLISLTYNDQENYAISVIRCINQNKMLSFASLAACYYDYDNSIAATSDPTAKANLIEAKQTFKQTLYSQIQSDSFGVYLLNLFKFLGEF